MVTRGEGRDKNTWYAVHTQMYIVHVLLVPEHMWPPFTTLFEAKIGEGAFAQIFNSSRAYASPSIPHNLKYTRSQRSQ